MKLRVDYDALEASARKLSEQGDIFQECIDIMTTEVNALPDIWEAETCDRYVERYNEAKPTLVDVRNLIEDMSQQAITISRNFREADESMRDQM